VVFFSQIYAFDAGPALQQHPDRRGVLRAPPRVGVVVCPGTQQEREGLVRGLPLRDPGTARDRMPREVPGGVEAVHGRVAGVREALHRGARACGLRVGLAGLEPSWHDDGEPPRGPGLHEAFQNLAQPLGARGSPRGHPQGSKMGQEEPDMG